ncbi:hypothetical protein D3C85_888550 [compost metagenome]
MIGQVVGQVFGHALGQGGDQHSLLDRHALGDFRQQVIDLGQRRANLDLRVDQTGRAYQLLDHATGVFRLVIARRGRNENRLRADVLEFVEAHRPVIERGGQTETVFHQRLFTGAVALIHGADLRHADVGFVDHQQGVGRQVVKQGGRRLAGFTTGQVARVVFDTVAIPQFENHLQVETGALLQALGFNEFVVGAQVVQALLQLDFDPFDSSQQSFPRGHVMAFRIEGEARQLADHFAGQRIEG